MGVPLASHALAADTYNIPVPSPFFQHMLYLWKTEASIPPPGTLKDVHVEEMK